MTQKEFFEHTQKLCDLLNALIPCKTQEDIDKMSSLLNDYFALPIHPAPKMYWSREIWIDCGFDDEKCINLLLFTDKLYFEPSDDMDEHPGVWVKYKWVKDQNTV